MAAQAAPVTDDASPLDVHPSPVSTAGRRSGRAVAAVVIGLVAILVVVLSPLISACLGIVAIIIGAFARGDIARSNCRGGREAVAGVVLGVVAIAAAIALVVVATA